MLSILHYKRIGVMLKIWCLL